MNSDHTGCYEYSYCTIYDDKCVKCQSNEYTDSNECKQCEGENIESCYFFNNNLNNICNEQSVNESNTCIINATVNMTANGKITSCQTNHYNSNNECKKCPDGCQKCSNGYCYLCEDDYQLRDGVCEKITDCKETEKNRCCHQRNRG